MTIEMHTDPDQGTGRRNDVHLNALNGIKTYVGRARYAAEQLVKANPWVETQEVRDWLTLHGHTDDNRSRVSTELNNLKKKLGVPTTGEIEAMTPEKLAELDVEQNRLAAPVQAPVQPEPTTAPPTRSAPAAERLDAPEPTVEPSKNDVPAPAPSKVERDQNNDRAAVQNKMGWGQRILLALAAVGLGAIIIAPFALSANKIIDWAGSPQGLGLSGDFWPVFVFIALDAAAFACVCMVVYCAWRGEGAGVFSWLIWAFAFGSAFANYNFSQHSEAAPDAWWFFPAMSIAGPFLLDVVTHRVRKWIQEGTGQRARHSVSFGFWRWVPGVGSFRDTYGAWRVARLDGISDAEQAVQEYRRLCPDGKLNVLSRLRERDNQ